MNLTAEIWIDLATSDLESSRLLHDSRHFRTSYFLFQQVTEKANKAYALLTGILKENELQKINHDTLKIYRRTSVKQEQEIKTLVKVLEPYPKISQHKIFSKIHFTKYHETLSDGVRFMDGLRNEDLVNIAAADLNNLLRELKKIKTAKITLPSNYEKKMEKIMRDVADWIGQFGTDEALKAKKEFSDFISDKQKAKEFYDIMCNKMVPMMIDLSFVHMTLFFCAIITVQHSSLSRYPESGKNPDLIYTKRLPLVQKQKQFMDMLADSLERLRHLNKL